VSTEVALVFCTFEAVKRFIVQVPAGIFLVGILIERKGKLK
jgi:hypothetical protein